MRGGHVGVGERGQRVLSACRELGDVGERTLDGFDDQLLARLQQLLAGDDDDVRRRAAVTLSAMVGAVMIARALGPTPRSDEILRDVREAVRERRLL